MAVAGFFRWKELEANKATPSHPFSFVCVFFCGGGE